MPVYGRDTGSRAKNGDSQGSRHPPPPLAGDGAAFGLSGSLPGYVAGIAGVQAAQP